ncbi:hypothetical protein E4U42_000052 [Claviceps africana]|uniref:Uncharacterized protein n=1 Tax=Claviceps africana TaxID=83212 RepID=A0A8K0NIK2_9HYPO|nr:hypothetical protein E4U42_000052 [Claviceps africana]
MLTKTFATLVLAVLAAAAPTPDGSEGKPIPSCEAYCQLKYPGHPALWPACVKKCQQSIGGN